MIKLIFLMFLNSKIRKIRIYIIKKMIKQIIKKIINLNRKIINIIKNLIKKMTRED